MGLLSLNEDVLIDILSLISPRDAKNLCMTCRDCYTIAMPRYLSSVELIPSPPHPKFRKRLAGIHRTGPSGPARVRLFCAFILADVKRRAPYLRELVLTTRAFVEGFCSDPEVGSDGISSSCMRSDYSCGADLARVLRHVTRLKKIRIEYPEPVFAAQPCVVDALATLPDLEVVCLEQIGPHSLDLLQRMASRPRELELAMGRRDRQGLLQDGAHLRSFTASLEVLRLHGCAEMLEAIDADAVWPSLRVLILSGATQRLSVPLLARAFPNLRSVRFGCSVVGGEVRAANWSSLDHVEVGCIVQLACPVRRLDLQRGLIHSRMSSAASSDAIAQVVTLLEHTSPVVLTLHIGLVTEEIFEPISGAVAGLRYLQIVMDWPLFGISGGSFNAEAWMMTPIPFFATQPLLGISLCVTSALDMRAGVRLPDMRMLAESVADAIPSLQYVGINLSGPTATLYNYALTWYRISSRAKDEPPQLYCIPHDEEHGIEEMLLALERPS